VTPGSSFTGLVFGMQATAVKPPATAAAVPVGHRLLVLLPRLAQVHVHVDEAGADHRSCRHGNHLRACRRAWRELADAGDAPVFDQHVRHAVETLRGIDHPTALSNRFMFGPSREQIQHRHPDRHAVGHLFQDDRGRAVRHL